MKIFRWHVMCIESQKYFDYFVMAESVEIARAHVIESMYHPNAPICCGVGAHAEHIRLTEPKVKEANEVTCLAFIRGTGYEDISERA